MQKITLILLSGLLSFSFVTICERIPESSNDVPETSVIDKQDNFHVVDAGFWRSAKPNRASLSRMKAFGLKTIINLQSDSLANGEEKNIADSLGLNYFHFPLDPAQRPDRVVLKKLLSIIQDSGNRPVLLHCGTGRNQTGLVTGIYKMQYSTVKFDDIYQEMLMYGYDEKKYPFIAITVEKWRDYMNITKIETESFETTETIDETDTQILQNQ